MHLIPQCFAIVVHLPKSPISFFAMLAIVIRKRVYPQSLVTTIVSSVVETFWIVLGMSLGLVSSSFAILWDIGAVAPSPLVLSASFRRRNTSTAILAIF